MLLWICCCGSVLAEPVSPATNVSLVERDSTVEENRNRLSGPGALPLVPEPDHLESLLVDPRQIPAPPVPPSPFELTPESSGHYKLSVSRCVERAWSESPEIKASDSRVRQAYWAMQGSDAFPSTTLGLGSFQGSGEILNNGNYINSPSPDYYVYLTQTFKPVGTLATSRRIAFRDFTQAQQAAALVRIQLAQRVKDAYYTLLAAQEQVRTSESNLDLARRVLSTTESRFKAGAGPRLDQINATVQFNRSFQDLTLATSQVRQAQARLAPLLALPPQSEIDPDGVLAPPAGDFVYEKLVEIARQHPRLQAAEEALDQSAWQRKLSEQQSNPTPGIYAVYDIQKPSWLAQLMLSIPIDWGGIRNDVRSKAEAEKEKAQLLYSERFSLAAELRASFEAYQAAYLNAASYVEGVLKPAEESARITGFGYKRGAVPFLQLLSAQQQQESVRKDYIDRQLSVHLALDALEAAVGRQLEIYPSGEIPGAKPLPGTIPEGAKLPPARGSELPALNLPAPSSPLLVSPKAVRLSNQRPTDPSAQKSQAILEETKQNVR